MALQIDFPNLKAPDKSQPNPVQGIFDGFDAGLQRIGTWWNKVNGTYQQQLQQEQYQAQQNAFNSAGAQKARLMGAGYSERQAMDILSGGANPAGVQQTPVQAQNGGGVAGMIGSLLGMGEVGSAIMNTSANTDLTNFQAQAQAIENKYQDQIKQLLITRGNEDLYGAVVSNDFKKWQLDWEQTVSYYQEQGMKREDILNELTWRYMMAELYNSPQFSSWFPDYTSSDLNSDLVSGSSNYRNNRQTITQQTYDDLPYEQKQHYELTEDKNGRAQWTEKDPREYRPTQDAKDVFTNNLYTWFNQAYSDMFQSGHDLDIAKAESENVAHEIQNFIASLDAETASYLVEGNLNAIRNKLLETKDDGEHKWWQMAYVILSAIAGPMSAFGVRAPSVAFGRFGKLGRRSSQTPQPRLSSRYISRSSGKSGTGGTWSETTETYGYE